MNKSFIQKSFNAISILFLLLVAMAPTFAQAKFQNPLGDKNVDFAVVLGRIIKWMLGLVGSLGLLALIWGGISYIIAFGSEKGAEKAKKIILWAIAGIAVAVLSYAIVNIVVYDLLGAPK